MSQIGSALLRSWSEGPMHCFFYLVNGGEVIPDDTGVEVPDLATAQSLALRAAQEIRDEADRVDEDWQGWRLNIICPQGSVLASICLSTFLQRPFLLLGGN